MVVKSVRKRKEVRCPNCQSKTVMRVSEGFVCNSCNRVTVLEYKGVIS